MKLLHLALLLSFYMLHQVRLDAADLIMPYAPRMLKISVYRSSVYDERLFSYSPREIHDKLDKVNNYTKLLDMNVLIIAENIFYLKVAAIPESNSLNFACLSREEGVLVADGVIKKLSARAALQKIKFKLNYDFTTLQAAGVETYSEGSGLKTKLIESITDSKFDSLLYNKKTLSETKSRGYAVTQFNAFGQESDEYIVEDYLLRRSTADYTSLTPDQRMALLGEFKKNRSYKNLISTVKDYRSKSSPFGYEAQIESLEIVTGITLPTLEDFLNSKN
jgi:hypothetical protein